VRGVFNEAIDEATLAGGAGWVGEKDGITELQNEANGARAPFLA
jgi:hypothetical protein